MGAYRVGVPIDVYGISLLKCIISAFILRCSACTVNDIFDRNLDANVGKDFDLRTDNYTNELFRTVPNSTFAKRSYFRFGFYHLPCHPICHWFGLLLLCISWLVVSPLNE